MKSVGYDGDAAAVTDEVHRSIPKNEQQRVTHTRVITETSDFPGVSSFFDMTLRGKKRWAIRDGGVRWNEERQSADLERGV
jgi:hypothetical protein